MEAEDFINLPVSDDENNEVKEPDCRPSEADSRVNSSDNVEDDSKSVSMEISAGDDENESEQKKQDEDIASDSHAQLEVELTGNVELVDTAIASDQLVSSNSIVENGLSNVHDGSLICNRMDVSSTLGVKRARMTVDQQSPSVRIIYSCISRASKQKLEELLQQWSEWEGQHGSSSRDLNEVIESGEETYFPAIRVGLKKGSSVSYWMDDQTRNQQNSGSLSLDSKTVPLYDRGFSLGLTSGDGTSNMEGALEIVDDASRCFNCGSYSHALKECPRPRDNVAVNNARKLHKSKRNLNSASRNPTRYYLSSVGGKFAGLRPGVLDAETREVLGLGELDPPPWLSRMRELGYPPGYLDVDIEDQPSGITIYDDDEESKEEQQEDGEILETNKPEPKRKKTVEFPGINAPIPENADEKLWAAGSSNSDTYRDRNHHRSNHHSESTSRGHHREQRWSRDYREDSSHYRDDGPHYRDDGPPGCDPIVSPSSYPPRYHSSYDSSPIFGRFESDRYRRSPYEDYNNRRDSRFENEVDYGFEHPDRNVDEYDKYRHRSSRW